MIILHTASRCSNRLVSVINAVGSETFLEHSHSTTHTPVADQGQAPASRAWLEH